MRPRRPNVSHRRQGTPIRRVSAAPPESDPVKHPLPTAPPPVFAPPTPKVSRQAKGKVLTPAQRAAFLASRPDLKG